MIKNKAPSQIIYIDESGIDSFISREHARSLKGHVVLGEKAGKRFARESFVAGLKNGKSIAPFCYTGTMDSQLFNFWLVNFLVPAILPGDIVIMDNAAFHKSEETRRIIQAANCELMFLPPYSPDLNPIEKFWANLKAKIRGTIDQFSSLAEAIDAAFCVDQLNFN